jgi:hypothetical protein
MKNNVSKRSRKFTKIIGTLKNISILREKDLLHRQKLVFWRVFETEKE